MGASAAASQEWHHAGSQPFCRTKLKQVLQEELQLLVVKLDELNVQLGELQLDELAHRLDELEKQRDDRIREDEALAQLLERHMRANK